MAVLWAVGALCCTQFAFAQALPANALPVLRGIVSGQVVVNAPTLSGSGGALLSIDQAGSRAIIDWRSFNIGSASEVRFNHALGSTASTLNRIYSADPSVIQGKLTSVGPIDAATGKATAGGQIILVNQNGILFDRGSQVNAYSLVASTLNISNDFYNRGLLAADDPTINVATPAFAGGYRLDGDGRTDPSIATAAGAIRIGAGGAASAGVPSIATPAGGNVLMFAPVIENKNGLITAPDGQVILAAGSKVYLTAQGAQDQGVRGFLVEVTAGQGDVNLTSLLTNQGQISADRGNVTLAGLALNQEGRVTASTAVLYNGTVLLKAATRVGSATGPGLNPEFAGTVTLGANSVTATPLDTSDSTTLAESQAYASTNLADDRRGRIQITGRTIDVKGTVQAPGGAIALDASSPVAGERGRIYLDQGGRIDAAGNWADVAYDSNFATFRVTSSELKDSPDQKDGILRGATVTVDLRKSSSLLDIGGYVDGRRRTVGEKATVGGSVELNSSGDVIQRQGATVDVSGGGYRHAGGTSKATQLFGADGRVYDIATAPQQRTYVAQLDKYTQTFDRWGQTRVYDNLLGSLGASEAAYVEGRAGGSLAINAPQGLVLDGTLKGGVTIGPKQLAAAPAGATLALGTDITRPSNPTPVPALRFTAQADDRLGAAFNAQSALPAAVAREVEIAATTLFAPQSAASGDTIESQRFASVEVNSRGRIALPADVTLDAGIGNSVVLRGAAIDIAGRIEAPAGSVLLQGRSVAGSDAVASPESVTLRSGASISTAGVWRNNSNADGSAVGPSTPSAVVPVGGGTARSTLQGGTVALSGLSFDVQQGSMIDVSGGGSVDRNGRISAGNGGSLTLAADRGTLPQFSRAAGELRGFSLGGTGGSLALSTYQVQVGGLFATPDSTLRVDEDFFSSGGFSSWSLGSVAELKVMAGTQLRPQTESWVLASPQAVQLASGSALYPVASRAVLREDLRPAASVTLAAAGSAQGESKVRLEQGASIVTDARGKVGLDAVHGIGVDGRIEAPAGSITLNLRGASQTAPVLSLGSGAELLARGAFVAKPAEAGLRRGDVLDGGSVSITATRGSIQAAAGSRIDVSGASQVIDVASADPRAPAPIARSVGSNAGSVLLRAQERSTLGSSLEGHAGGANNAGGSFAVEFTNRNEGLLRSDPSVDRRIVVTQAPSALPAQAGTVDLAVDSNRLVTGGFDKLRLQSGGRIDIAGSTTLEFDRAVQLDTPELRIADGARLNVDAASVTLANSFGAIAAPGYQGTAGSRNNFAASRPVATRAGSGILSVQAGTIDVLGDVTLNGVASTTLSARGDLRLSGRSVGDALSEAGATLTGSLVSEGDIALHAAQVLPTTRSSFTVAVQSRSAAGSVGSIADGRLAIGASGQQPGAALSADGALTLRADRIHQAGTLRAPLGRLALDGGSAVTLAAGSVTSVSADGLTLPYGSTIDQRDWTYAPTNGRADLNALTAPPAKQVTLKANAVTVAAGAKVDVSGGGNVQASEFVPGSGGSTDTLLKDNTFAILPAANLSSMPVDREIAGRKDLGLGPLTARPDGLAYDTIHIGHGAAVPQGDYVLLPGRYALLPDAYVVTLQTGSTYANLQPGQTARLVNGQVVAPGYRKVAGTSIREEATIGVVVRPGSAARRESDYALSDASFFADRADRLRQAVPALPADGGRFSITGTSAIRLDGDIATAAQTGARASQVDIAAARIGVVDGADSSAVDASFVKLDATNLSRIGGSVLIGGTRSDTADGVRVQAVARDVVVATDGKTLEAPELMFVATEQLGVRTGSVLRGTGAAVAAPDKIVADTEGTLLRLSSGSAVTVDRGSSATARTRGSIEIQPGATLAATGSVTLDATRSLQLGSSPEVAAGGGVALAAGAVRVGAAAAAPSGALVLTAADLRRYDALGSLALKSYSAIEFAGDVNVGAPGLGALLLDTPRLQGAAGNSAGNVASVSAQQLTLRNSSSLAGEVTGGAGRLALQAQTLTIGSGDKAITGFGSVELRSSGDTVAHGSGSLQVAAPTTFAAPRITAAPGSDQRWRAAATQGATTVAYDLALTSAATSPANAPAATAGGRLALEGRTLQLDTTIAMPSGIVSLSAQGGGAGDNLTLGSRAAIDVGAHVQSFAGRQAVADAGSVSLDAAGRGSVVAQAGSRLNLAGNTAGGAAGSLDIAAGGLDLAGRIDAGANAGQTQGRVGIDVAALPDFSALNNTLDSAGFSERRALRVRSGDLRVAAGDTVKAHEIELAADAGRIDLQGRIDASGSNGRVALYAGNGIAIAGRIDASGTGTDAGAAAAPTHGGVVTADTRGGTLAFAPGASIDVRGGAKGRSGRVDFVAPTAGSAIAADLQGTVMTRRSDAAERGEVAVQGRRIVGGVGEVTSELITQWSADHAQFMRAVDVGATTGRLQSDGSKHVRSLLELQSPGDITFGADWNLTTPAWLTGSGTQASEPGTLSVRAAGDVIVKRALGLPDDKLVAGKTWSLQIAAGSDLGASNSLAVQPLGRLAGGKGSLRMAAADAPLRVDATDPSGAPLFDPNTGEIAQVEIDQAAKIRTGSGSIRIAAGRDVVFDRGTLPSADAKRVIYTAGLPTAPQDQSSFTQGLDTPWADGGGDISIRAGQDVIGRSQQWVNGWLRRPRGTIEDAGESGWFVHRPNFQYNVGALGGGNVSIAAGRDVRDLSAAAPTMGRVTGTGATRQLQVTGGGDLSVAAGQRIEGGDFVVGRGSGSFTAGGSIGTATPTQLFLMGESADAGTRGASARVNARNGVRLQSVDDPTAQALPQARSLAPQQYAAEADADGNPLIDPGTGLPFYLPVSARNFEAGQGATSSFFTSSSNNTLSVASLAGDITLGGKALAKPALTLATPGADNESTPGAAVYPGMTSATAFVGAIKGAADQSLVTLFPTASSSLSLLAASDVSQLNLFVSDRSPNSLAAWDRPTLLSSGLLAVSANTPRTSLVPVEGYRYDVVAASGSITGLSANLPDAARVQAGLDIVGGNFNLNHRDTEAVSLLRAVEGDVRPRTLTVGGPGQVLVQAGRNIDAGTQKVGSVGNLFNASLSSPQGARMIFIAGVAGDVDLSKLDGAFGELTALNQRLNEALALYRLLDAERDPQRVLGAQNIETLAQINPAYAQYVELGRSHPRVLGVYQDTLRSTRVPLGSSADTTLALDLYARLNAETDPARLQRILKAESLSQLAADPAFASTLGGFADLDRKYPTLFSDYRIRRANGFTPTSVLPIVYGTVLDEAVAKVFPQASVRRGSIDSFLTSIESSAGGGIDLVAPAGDITVGLTTPRPGEGVGVLTTAGGDIRSFLSGNFNINQGKVVTAQGGDILIYSSRGNIDAGRGARTSQTSPAPVRVPKVEDGVVVGFTTRIPAGFSGSGIQTLSSDPDGQGPLPPARAGTVRLFTPSGYVDAGEAGIVSGGDLVIVAQTVLNAANISAGGSSVGVPVAVSGSLASSVASSGGNSTASKAGEDAANAAANAARAATATAPAKPAILVVEVLGFGEKNCKEGDKDCFAK